MLNHALVVSDGDWLQHSKHLVLDEAHNLEDAATEALSQTVTRGDLEALCDALWDRQSRRGTVRRLADAAGWSLHSERGERTVLHRRRHAEGQC